jgi:hypothetical protein
MGYKTKDKSKKIKGKRGKAIGSPPWGGRSQIAGKDYGGGAGGGLKEI